MTERCDVVGNCRGTVLCPCGCGACVVHCPHTPEGESWIDQQLAMLETLRSRRHAWLGSPEQEREAHVQRLRAKALRSREAVYRWHRDPADQFTRRIG